MQHVNRLPEPDRIHRPESARRIVLDDLRHARPQAFPGLGRGRMPADAAHTPRRPPPPPRARREPPPAVITGADLLVSSQTGSGKTAAFVLPGLQRLRTPPSLPGKGPRMLVLAPTRALAMQVQKATHGYCSGQKLLTALLVGGMPYGLQLAQLRKPVDIAIATPGRLKDHLDRGSVDLARVELLVLDEADRMLDR